MSMDDRVRRAVVAGTLGALSIFLGLTRLGFIPWFAGAALTIMHVPVIIGAVIEGPVVGLIVGILFGVTSLFQAAVAPVGAFDPFFTNPVVSILPRLFIGPVAWFVFRAIRSRNIAVGAVVAGIVGSITNTVLVLGSLGLVYGGAILGLMQQFELGDSLLAFFGGIAVANGLPEAGLSAVITLAVVGAWRLTAAGKRTVAGWSGRDESLSRDREESSGPSAGDA
ncbi:MAG: ECF transporter S component [Spirochaetaceae bacterium]|nr:MAG: ECF transporter S component [Spirochaetaceae bacterium]